MRYKSIDWSKTVAYAKPDKECEVCVNQKGREENGIVSSDDYDSVQEKIIDALLDWRDPSSGKRAITYTLKKRDLPVLENYGSEVGDVFFAHNPGYHGVFYQVALTLFHLLALQQTTVHKFQLVNQQ